ncbi:secretin N-terminal domain-containing protein [Botrimarina mediterranea]|nr:secretin N-terminal domain-containing protein [Botrimarina mediterranea]
MLIHATPTTPLPTRRIAPLARAVVMGVMAIVALVPSPNALAQVAADSALEAHSIPAERRGAVEAWRKTLPADVRTVWDDRTGRLLLFGPLETHAELMRLVTGAEGAQPQAIGPQADGVGVGSTLSLKRLSPTELHGRLESLARRPLPATWDAGHTVLSFPASLGDGAGVRFRVDGKSGEVAIDGPADAVAAWRDVVAAIEESIAAQAGVAGSKGSSVRILSTAAAPPERVKTALQAIQVAAPIAARPVAGQVAAEDEGGDQPSDAPQARVAEDESILGPVQIEFVEGLDVIVLRGDQEDVDRVMKIIDQIESLSSQTTPEIKVLRLEHIDADSLARLLTNVYDQVLGPRVGDLSVTGLAKPNALLLVGRPENVRLAVSLVEQLDQPVEPTYRFEAYSLKHVSATDAKALIDSYFEQQAAQNNDQAASLLRSRAFTVADVRSNVVIVSAAPRDQEEVRALLKQVDAARGEAVDEVRVFPLKNSLAEDLAEVLLQAIQPSTESDAENATPRVAALRLSVGEGDPTALESGVLNSVRVSADARANSLVVTAPAESMGLIAALIERLDRTPDASAELKVFTIANGDAAALADMLRSLFATEEDSDDPGGYGSGGLSRLSVSTDLRSNSIIAAGTAEDLAVVEAILLRLDDAEVRSRQTTVFRLKNADATTVSQVLNEWLENERSAEAEAELGFSPRELIEREVIIVAEPATNSLIVSSTPRYEQELRRLVEELDERPPMVVVQVLIAEVSLNDTDEFGVELGLQDSLLFDRSLLSDTQFITTTTNEQSPGGAAISTTTQNIISSNLTPGYNFNNQPLGNNGSTTSLAQAGNIGAQALSSFALSRVNSDLNFGGFVMSASSSNVNFLLRALQESRRLEVLSRPQITTIDGKVGRVQVGARVPRIAGVTQNNFGQTNNVEYEDVGIILEVQPRISVDGQVIMNVAAEKSELGPEAEGVAINISTTGDVVRAPQIKTTQATTTVSAASGQTIVLSGLLTKRTLDIHRRVPLLADIPLIGDLFRYDAVQQGRTELLIILTPRVIRSELDAEMLKQVESSRMSWVLSDVIEMHGPSGLRTRGDAWDDVPGCFPTELPPGGPVLGEVKTAAPIGEAEEPVAEVASRVEAASYSKPFIPPRRLPTVAP